MAKFTVIVGAYDATTRGLRLEFFFREYVTEKAYHLFGRSTLGWTSATTHTHSNTISSDTPVRAWLIIQPATGYKRVPCYQEIPLKITHIIVLAISWLLGKHFSSLSLYLSSYLLYLPRSTRRGGLLYESPLSLLFHVSLLHIDKNAT